MAGLWLLRHGSLPPNPERRFVGARDIALTAAVEIFIPIG